MMNLSRKVILSMGLVVSLLCRADSLPGDWSYLSLQHDWRASEVLDGTVYSHDGLQVGRVNDVILSADGKLKSIIVEQQENRRWRYFQVPWHNARFTPSVKSVTIEISRDEADKTSSKEEPDFVRDDEYEISDLLGVSVDAQDMNGYGRVVDLLFSPNDNQLTAVVVKMSGPGRKLYAVPGKIRDVHTEGKLSLPYSRAEMKKLERFVESWRQ